LRTYYNDYFRFLEHFAGKKENVDIVITKYIIVRSTLMMWISILNRYIHHYCNIPITKILHIIKSISMIILFHHIQRKIGTLMYCL